LRGLSVKMGIGKWKLENRKWQIETRKWTLENGHEQSGVAISSFQFPFSSFEFPFSNFEFPQGAKCCKLFDHLPPELLYWRKTFLKFESK
jgi:hypothetical protein